jgi:hypothetical protein
MRGVAARRTALSLSLMGTTMAGDDGTTWRHDVSPADWIGPRLHPFAVDTGSVIPEGYEAYGRLFHPVEPEWPDRRVRTWSEVAAENGRIAHGEMQFHMINRRVGAPAPQTYVMDHGPDWGSLPLRELSELVAVLRSETTTPDQCWFCLWDGFGGVDFGEDSERVQLPSRDYGLYSGPIERALAALDSFGDRRSPNLWWPQDRAWIVATEIDYAWTYIGGSAGLVEKLLARDTLEVLAAQLTDKPFYDADIVNAALDQG